MIILDVVDPGELSFIGQLSWKKEVYVFDK
jgi:hypothetical protein